MKRGVRRPSCPANPIASGHFNHGPAGAIAGRSAIVFGSQVDQQGNDGKEGTCARPIADVIICSRYDKLLLPNLPNLLFPKEGAMPTFEFQTLIDSSGKLAVPPQLAEQLEPGKPIRVILVVEDPDEDADWARLTYEQFVLGCQRDDEDNADGPLPTR